MSLDRTVALLLLKLARSWLRESATRPIRVATYGSKDDLEHCADELERTIRAMLNATGHDSQGHEANDMDSSGKMVPRQ